MGWLKGTWCQNFSHVFMIYFGLFYGEKTNRCRFAIMQIWCRFGKEWGKGTWLALLLFAACYIFLILLTIATAENVCINMFELMFPNYKA